MNRRKQCYTLFTLPSIVLAFIVQASMLASIALAFVERKV